MAVTSSVPLVCASSVDTGEGRLLADGSLALGSSSSSGAIASLLGAGVRFELLAGAVNLSLSFGFLGELRSGSLVTAAGVGVLEKKPWRVRCLPSDSDFLRVEGVGVGVADVFLGIMGNAVTSSNPLLGRPGL